MKRGQVTLFVILGIVIVAVVAVGVYFRSQLLGEEETELEEELALPVDVRQVRQFVRSCVETAAEDGLVLLGLQGGVTEVPADSLDLGTGSIAFAYDKGRNNFPSLEEMKQSYADFIDENVIKCFNPEDFPNMAIEEFEPNTLVDFADDKVKTSTEYKLVVSRGDTPYNLFTPYTAEFPVRMRHIHDVSSKIVQDMTTSPDDVDVNFLIGLGADIEVQPVEDDTVVYVILDDQSKVGEEQFTFIFANRF